LDIVLAEFSYKNDHLVANLSMQFRPETQNSAWKHQ